MNKAAPVVLATVKTFVGVVVATRSLVATSSKELVAVVTRKIEPVAVPKNKEVEEAEVLNTPIVPVALVNKNSPPASTIVEAVVAVRVEPESVQAYVVYCEPPPEPQGSAAVTR